METPTHCGELSGWFVKTGHSLSSTSIGASTTLDLQNWKLGASVAEVRNTRVLGPTGHGHLVLTRCKRRSAGRKRHEVIRRTRMPIGRPAEAKGSVHPRCVL